MPRRHDLERDLASRQLRIIDWDGARGRRLRLSISPGSLTLSSRPLGEGSGDAGWYRNASSTSAVATLYKSWFGFGAWKLRIRAERHPQLGEAWSETVSLPEEDLEEVRQALAWGGYLEGEKGAEPEATDVPAQPEPIPEGAWNEDLFAALRDDPGPETAAVLGDWLSEQGDPRGQLIGLQLAQEPITELLSHQVFFYGADIGASVVSERSELFAPGRDHEGLGEVIALWRWGFVEALAIPLGYPDWDREGLEPAAATTLLEHPSCRMLQELVFQAAMCTDPPRLPVLPTVSAVRIGDFFFPEECEMSWSQMGSWDLTEAFPGLERLHLQGGFDAVTFGPGVKELVLESSTASGELVRSLIAQAPAAHRITIWTGAEEYGSTVTLDDLEPLLSRELDHLGLMNCAFTDALVEPLARSQVLKQLTSLDLSLGTLSDDGARILAEHAPAFAHLTRLNLDENCVVEQEAVLRGLFGAALSIERQKTDHGYGTYISVAE